MRGLVTTLLVLVGVASGLKEALVKDYLVQWALMVTPVVVMANA